MCGPVRGTASTRTKQCGQGHRRETRACPGNCMQLEVAGRLEEVGEGKEGGLSPARLHVALVMKSVGSH
jgi:hypothetical protein